MLGSQYRRGRSWEYEIVRRLRSDGWIAQRSAGSHSLVDIWAIHPLSGAIQLIQCKIVGKARRVGSWRDANWRRLVRLRGVVPERVTIGAWVKQGSTESLYDI